MHAWIIYVINHILFSLLLQSESQALFDNLRIGLVLLETIKIYLQHFLVKRSHSYIINVIIAAGEYYDSMTFKVEVSVTAEVLTRNIYVPYCSTF